MKRPEQALQMACVKYMRHQYPKVLCFHVPNQGTEHRTRGAILRGMGVVSGVPDLLIVHEESDGSRTRNGHWSNAPGLAIELKAGKGRSTLTQASVQTQFVEASWVVHEVRDFDTFKKTVDDYLK